MPRLDETEPKTVESLRAIDPDLAESEPPWDVCIMCYVIHGFTDEVEHPPYDESDPAHPCLICGKPLNHNDD